MDSPPPPPPPVDGPPPPELEPPVPPSVEPARPRPPAGRSRQATYVAIGAVAVIALIVGIAASMNGGGSGGSQTEPTGPVILPTNDVPSDFPTTTVPTTAGSSCLDAVPGTQVDVGISDPVVVVIPEGWVQAGTAPTFNYPNQWTVSMGAQPGVFTDTPAVDYLNQLGFQAQAINPPAGSRIVSEGYDAQAEVLLAIRDDGEKLNISALPLTQDASAADRTIVSHLLASVVVTFGCPDT